MAAVINQEIECPDNYLTRAIIDGISGPRYRVVHDKFKFAPGFDTAHIAVKYEARPDDIFIVTYPKCGTTWTQNIVIGILNGGKIPPNKKLFELSPFLEMSTGRNLAETLPRPIAIKTHMRYEIQPKNKTAKYILVLRNPKDALVSFYYHHKRSPSYDVPDMDFHDFFKFYLAGELECGSYFDWVKSWWKEISQRNISQDKDNSSREISPENVLVLIYEDMKTDMRAAILKIAQFLGDQYLQDLTADNEAKLKDVISCSSFDNMKEKSDLGMRDGFFRKGIIGDFKNHFNEKENQIMERTFHEQFDGTGLEHLWDKYQIFG